MVALIQRDDQLRSGRTLLRIELEAPRDDRIGRREYLAWVVSTLAALVLTLDWLGVLPDALARHWFLVAAVCVAMTLLSIEYILRQALGMTRPSRAWAIMMAITVASRRPATIAFALALSWAA